MAGRAQRTSSITAWYREVRKASEQGRQMSFVGIGGKRLREDLQSF